MAGKAYFTGLLSSIAPLITVDETDHVRYVNDSFLREFRKSEEDVLGKTLFSVLKLTKSDRKDFLENKERSKKEIVQNCEFSLGRRLFGYSLFHYQNETGIILKDITALKKLRAKVENLHSRLLNLQEEERQRIAAELHDGVGQTILAAKLNLVAAKTDSNDQRAEDRYRTGLELIDRASQELREIYTDLYPSTLKELGIEATIRSFARNFLEVNGCSVTMDLNLKKHVPYSVQVQLFRIVQEIFSNIVRHSGAKAVSIRMKNTSDGIEFRADDDGVGIGNSVNTRSSGFGLTNISRRIQDMNGDFSIRKRKGGGTSIKISVPYPQENQ